MTARQRHKETPVDEEKIKHFSKKFEEQDTFSDDTGVPQKKQEEDEKLKSVLHRFAEIDEPKEEKRQKQLKEAVQEKETKHPSTKEEQQAQTPSSANVAEKHPTSSSSSSAQQQATSRSLTKAELYAIQQYQAKLAELPRSSIKTAIKNGFFFGVGLLLFFILLSVILVSIAIIKGMSVYELLQMLI